MGKFLDFIIKLIMGGAIAVLIVGLFAIFGSETAKACGYSGDDETVTFRDDFLKGG